MYRFRDPDGRVIYVGKAKSLRQRLSSYFADPATLHPRTRQMVRSAAAVDWTVVASEVEALQLEYSWIKEFDPRFNVRYRDDKSYPSLAVTLDEQFPRLTVMRGPRRRGVRYFGPYAHAWAIRETLDMLLRVFPARTCSDGVFRRAKAIGRPCLFGDIGKCSAPCVGRVDEAEHRAIVERFCDFMSGRADRMIRGLEADMLAAAGREEFERAARLRDDVAALRRALEKQAVVLPPGTSADVIGIAEDALEAAVAVFHVRDGRVRGRRGYVIDKVEDVDTGDLVGQFLTQTYGEVAPSVQPEPGADPGSDAARRYGPEGPPRRRVADGDGPDLPAEVLATAVPADAAALAEWLSVMRGSRVDVRVPRRGDKRALLETVERNAAQAFTLHKMRRASDLSARSRALQEVQDALGLEAAPLRIECFDVSHVQGSDVVAAMVVFEDGLARRGEYRRFAIRGVAGGDDTRWLAETLTRRFAHVEASPDAGSRPRRFAYPPQLVVVDGGAPQVEAAADALRLLGVEVALCGLAKRLEEVWLPGEPEPVVLSRTSEGLYLLQRIRDEAHRFAITYHRQKRSRSMVSSALDGVPGLGEVRRRALLTRFGSLRRLRAASVEEIAGVPGIGPATAEAVVAALSAGGVGDPAVDPRTGEVVG